MAAGSPFNLNEFVLFWKFLGIPRQSIGCLFVNLPLHRCSYTTCILKRYYFILLKFQVTANLIAHCVQVLIYFIIGRLIFLYRQHVSTHISLYLLFIFDHWKCNLTVDVDKIT